MTTFLSTTTGHPVSTNNSPRPGPSMATLITTEDGAVISLCMDDEALESELRRMNDDKQIGQIIQYVAEKPRHIRLLHARLMLQRIEPLSRESELWGME